MHAIMQMHTCWWVSKGEVEAGVEFRHPSEDALDFDEPWETDGDPGDDCWQSHTQINQ